MIRAKLRFFNLMFLTIAYVFGLGLSQVPMMAFPSEKIAAGVGFAASGGKFFSRLIAIWGQKKHARRAKLVTEACSILENCATLSLPAISGEKIAWTTFGENIRLDASAQVSHVVEIIRAGRRVHVLYNDSSRDTHSVTSGFSAFFSLMELVFRSVVFAQLAAPDIPEVFRKDRLDFDTDAARVGAEFDHVWRQFKVVGFTTLAWLCDFLSRKSVGQHFSLIDEACLKTESLFSTLSFAPLLYNVSETVVRVAMEEDDQREAKSLRKSASEKIKRGDGFSGLWKRIRQ